MYFKPPKNDERISWTKHVKEKMRFYGLSQSRLQRVLSNPQRQEAGIAPGTIALMQPAGSKKHPTEIWLMYKAISPRPKIPKPSQQARSCRLDKSQKLRIITAWRYPGKSPVREGPPVPEDIVQDLTKGPVGVWINKATVLDLVCGLKSQQKLIPARHPGGLCHGVARISAGTLLSTSNVNGVLAVDSILAPDYASRCNRTGPLSIYATLPRGLDVPSQDTALFASAGFIIIILYFLN